jgi:putative transposase
VLSEHDLPIAPSTYYAHKAQPVSDADWDDAHMANAALDMWRANRSLYGADKLATAMRKAGYDVGRDQVARLMGIVAIEGVRRGKHPTVTTVRRRQGRPPPRPHPPGVEHTDTTGPVVGGRLHLRLDPGRLRVHELRHRRVLAADPRLAYLELQDHTAGHVGSRAGPVHPSPRRCPVHLQGPGLPLRRRIAGQYTAITFTETLIEAGIAPSIGTVGDALDNALMESTIGLYKTELIEHDRTRSWTGRAGSGTAPRRGCCTVQSST